MDAIRPQEFTYTLIHVIGLNDQRIGVAAKVVAMRPLAGGKLDTPSYIEALHVW
jgi:hypothetical protein